MERLQVIPLGGLGEVGKNMMVFEYGRNIMIVDAGMMFPESYMLGVDYILPDYDYLRGKEDRIRGIVITHGHMDHIGALPHLLRDVNVPVYATRLTRGLIEVNLPGDVRKQTTIRTMMPGETLRIGPFTVEPYHTAHSIPDAVGLGITTPVGLVVHSGDYKLDHTPVDGWPTDIAKLVEFSERGVLALFADSTNADQPDTTPSERTLTSAFEGVFRQAKGRIIVATFASLISRIQQVMDVAQSFGRKVAVAGYSMVKNVRMARELGYLDVPDDLLLSLHEVNQLPPHKVMIMATGSQGEPRSIMGRLATGRHPSLRITRGDTVVLSSHTIPGNEESVNEVINRLFQRGAHVVYHPLAPVHVSGHASQAEQKTLLNIVKPKYFVPIHGELRHLKHHAALAQEVGIPSENVVTVENGYVLRFTKDKLRVGERIPGGYVFVDGGLVGESVDQSVIDERESLANSGVCSVVFHYDAHNGKLMSEPYITSKGFVNFDVSTELWEGARQQVRNTLKSAQPGTTADSIESAVGKVLSDYFYQQVRNRPNMLVTAISAG